MRSVVRGTVSLLLLAACAAPEEGPLMAPGQDCLRCHDGAEARAWTVAGTWARGSQVTITDVRGKSFTLRGNQVGNFYSAEPVMFPLTVSVDGKTMPDPVTYGGCNRCHGGGGAGVTGPLMAPGQDCNVCHDGRGAVRWTAAGTWRSSSGQAVTLVDSRGKTVRLTTNQVGNFYTAEPLTFPLIVSVGGERMPDPVSYGGCNRCHGPGGDDD
jgi:hypothetical protein